MELMGCAPSRFIVIEASRSAGVKTHDAGLTEVEAAAVLNRILWERERAGYVVTADMDWSTKWHGWKPETGDALVIYIEHDDVYLN